MDHLKENVPQLSLELTESKSGNKREFTDFHLSISTIKSIAIHKSMFAGLGTRENTSKFRIEKFLEVCSNPS